MADVPKLSAFGGDQLQQGQSTEALLNELFCQSLLELREKNGQSEAVEEKTDKV